MKIIYLCQWEFQVVAVKKMGDFLDRGTYMELQSLTLKLNALSDLSPFLAMTRNLSAPKYTFEFPYTKAVLRRPG